MTSSEHHKTTVHAIIPRGEDPTQFILTESGQYPSAMFCPEQDRTLENTFHRIGRGLGFAALSVDAREPNLGTDFVYRAKEVSAEATLPLGFEWKVLEGE